MQAFIPHTHTPRLPPSRPRRRRLLLVLALALAAGSIWWQFSAPKTAAKIYVTIPAKKGDIVLSVNASGSVNPVNTVTVGSQVSGPVTKVLVDFNDKVTKGQLLAEIDPSLLASQIAQSEAQLENNRTSTELAERNAERTKKLFEKGFVSRVEMENAMQSANSARTSYQVSKAQVDRDRKNLEYAQLRSPVDGVVISRSVNEGQTVQASFQAPELFKIAEDLTRMQIEINLGEADIARVKPGLPARFTVDAYPTKEFVGEVKKIRLAPAQGGGQATYQAVVAVDNSENLLLPGMTAAVSIVIDERKNVLLVANGAFRFRPMDEKNPGVPVQMPLPSAKPTVHVLRGGQPVPVEVEAGLYDTRWTEIVSGDLKEGDEVILREERPDEEF